jgi:signal transduction histidine kinase
MGEAIRDRFLAVVAHEMRNPLSTISAGIRIISQRPAQERIAEVLLIMERQVANLARLVEDLLDVSSISQGRLSISKKEIRISEVVALALETSRQAIEFGGHSLKVAAPEEPIVIDGDIQRLSQVVSNLLDNAAKYTPAGGEISLEVKRGAGEVILTVSDNGIGIPAEHAAHIFDVYRQIDRGDGTHKNGLGIGLYLVKMIIAAHRGNIEVHSDGDGKGSAFVVRIPCKD